jgi:hypothetical protein
MMTLAKISGFVASTMLGTHANARDRSQTQPIVISPGGIVAVESPRAVPFPSCAIVQPV